jgi:hypothetical protein
MNLPANELTSFGHALDLSPQAFGELRRSNDIAHDAFQLRARMAEDGYLYLPGLLDEDQVLAARREITDRLAAGGAIDPGHKPMDAIYGAGGDIKVGHGPAVPGSALFKLLYEGRMMAFYERLFGGPVRHYDFTWLRVVKPGLGTYPHCDVVYMGRGTYNLCTAWTPLGDIPLDVGGLMVLENSHRQADKLQPYLQRDVDAYCTNHPDAGLIESGQKQWQDWDGRLSSNPVTLREKLGGRWLTADFKAGDLLTFGMATVHASLDNQSNRLRLSSDSRYQLASEPADERWIGANPIAHGPDGKKGKVC